MQQLHLISLFITVENIRYTFHVVFYPSKHQSYLFSYFQTSKCVRQYLVYCLFATVNTLFLLFFAVQLVIASAASMLLEFNLEKHYSYFAFSFLTSFDRSYFLFWGVWTANTYTVLCFFVDRVQKSSCYLCLSTLASKNISGTLFLVCVCLNLFFLSFCGVLTWKYINNSYLVDFKYS